MKGKIENNWWNTRKRRTAFYSTICVDNIKETGIGNSETEAFMETVLRICEFNPDEATRNNLRDLCVQFVNTLMMTRDSKSSKNPEYLKYMKSEEQDGIEYIMEKEAYVKGQHLILTVCHKMKYNSLSGWIIIIQTHDEKTDEIDWAFTSGWCDSYPAALKAIKRTEGYKKYPFPM